MLTSSATTPPRRDVRLGSDYTTNGSRLTAQVKNKKLAATKHVKDRPGHEKEREAIK